MHELRLGLDVTAKADLGPARLELLAVRAGRDLAVCALTREPDLEIVGLGRGEPEVSRRKRDDAIRELEPLQDLLRVRREPLECLVGAFGLGDLRQLHLVELMLADEAADVLAVGARFAPEAGSVGAVGEREVSGLEDLAGMQVRHGDFRGRNQVVVGPGELEEVRLELRKLPGTEQALGVHDDRRQDLRIAPLARVEVHHERDQGPLEKGAGAFQNGEPRPCELRGALEVEDAELLAELPVRLRCEGERRGLADDPFDPVGRLVPADRHRGMRQVRDLGRERAHRALGLLEPLDERGDLPGPLPEGARIRLLLDRPADPLALLVLLLLEPAGLGDQPAPLAVELAEAFLGHLVAAGPKPAGDVIEVGPEGCGIQHSGAENGR